MPKTKKDKKVKPKRQQMKSSSEQDIQERIAACGRGDLRQIVYIGEMVEKVLLGEFGAVLRALLKGRQAMELNDSRLRSAISADRYLGRLDAYERIMDDLEQYVLDKDFAYQKAEKANKTEHDRTDLQHAPDVGVVQEDEQ